jgi:thymidylate synthase
MNTHWRSRDLFKAWFENVIALTTLMRKIAAAISERASRPVAVGRYVDISDSLHLRLLLQRLEEPGARHRKLR